MQTKPKQKGIEEYRHDIKVLKYKLNKLLEEKEHIKQKMHLNDQSSALYVRPQSKNIKCRTIDYYMTEFYLIATFRRISLEQLFRAFDLDQTNTLSINHFKSMLHNFLTSFAFQNDESKYKQQEEEISKMLSMICSQLDSNYKGIVDKNEYVQMIQIHRIESEPFTFQIRNISVQGVNSQEFQNIYEHALTVFKNYILVSKISPQQLVIQLKEALKLDTEVVKITQPQFLNFVNKFPGFSQNLALGLFNYFDRYIQSEIELKYIEVQVKKILEPSFNIKTSTQFLTLDYTQDQYLLSTKIREAFSQIKIIWQQINPIDAYLQCDKDFRGKVRIGLLFKIIEKIFTSKLQEFNINLILMWLRMLDCQKTYSVDCLNFIYSVINEEDINRFSSNQTERAKLIKTQNTYNDYEVISGFGLRLKSLSMKPSDWFKMLVKSSTQISVSVFEVKVSLFKLGIDIGHIVEIIKLLDQNINFFVEYDELMQLFGSQAAVKQEQNLDDAIKEFAGFLIKNYKTINNGINQIFSKYDEDKTGTLSREEFLYALDSIDEHLHLDDHQKVLILEGADKNRDNQITIQEFKDWIYQYTDAQALEPSVVKQRNNKNRDIIDDQTLPSSPKGEILKVAQLACNTIILSSINKESVLSQFNFYKIMSQHNNENKLFTDTDFPAAQRSLTNDVKRFPKALGIEWLRPIDFLGKIVRKYFLRFQGLNIDFQKFY